MKLSFLLVIATTALESVWAETGRAADKALCISNAESGQELRQAGDLAGAHDRFLICAVPSCPDMVASDCTRWLAEVDQAIEAERGQQASPPKPASSATLTPRAAATETTEPPPRRGALVPSRSAEATSGGRGVPAAVWVLTGIGVAGLGSFVYFGLSGRSEEARLVSSCAPHCPTSDADVVRTKYLVADVSLAVGAVAVAAAVWILANGASANATAPAHVALDMSGLHF